MLQERDRRSRAMIFNLHLVLLVLVTVLLIEYLTSACDIEIARNPPDDGITGGWSGVAVDDDSVVQLRQTVVNDAVVTKAHHIIESYQQVDHVTLVSTFNARNVHAVKRSMYLL